MRNTKADRRSLRTRQQLSAALIALMLEKRYDEISVQDIIDRANVGRSTFYAHYLDKEDLLVSDFTRVVDALSPLLHQEQHGAPHPVPSLAPFFHHVQTHHQLYKALARGGGIEFLYKKGHQRLRHNIEQHLKTLVPADQTPGAPLAFVADYTAGAILTVLTWWLDNQMPFPPEDVDAMFRRLVLPGIQATLHIPDSALETPR